MRAGLFASPTRPAVAETVFSLIAWNLLKRLLAQQAMIKEQIDRPGSGIAALCRKDGRKGISKGAPPRSGVPLSRGAGPEQGRASSSTLSLSVLNGLPCPQRASKV